MQKKLQAKVFNLDESMLPSCKLLTGSNIDVSCLVTSKEPVRAYAVVEKTSAIQESQSFFLLIHFRSTLGEHPVMRSLLTTKLHGSTIDYSLSNA